MLNKEKTVEVIVDKEKCTKCGICVDVCDNYLQKDESGYPKAKPVEESSMGCIQCGRCMMNCPSDAIEIKGEDIDKNHLREMPEKLPDYNDINSLFLKRRSCRKFKQEDVSKDDIDKIISAAATAAVSVPPSEVKVLVFKGRDKVQQLADDIVNELKGMMKSMNPLVLSLMKIFMSEAKYKTFKDFIIPLCNATVNERANGNDILFYNAPAVMVFYGTELTGKEDMIIAATQATIAAESLNLGTCIIGAAGAAFGSKKLKQKYGILKGEKIGMTFILGVPDQKFLKTFQRNFKEVRIID